jgi:hypothetical protein
VHRPLDKTIKTRRQNSEECTDRWKQKNKEFTDRWT